jgi:hypothetical protein
MTLAKTLERNPSAKARQSFVTQMRNKFPDAPIRKKDSPTVAIEKALDTADEEPARARKPTKRARNGRRSSSTKRAVAAVKKRARRNMRRVLLGIVALLGAVGVGVAVRGKVKELEGELSKVQSARERELSKEQSARKREAAASKIGFAELRKRATAAKAAQIDAEDVQKNAEDKTQSTLKAVTKLKKIKHYGILQVKYSKRPTRVGYGSWQTALCKLKYTGDFTFTPTKGVMKGVEITLKDAIVNEKPKSTSKRQRHLRFDVNSLHCKANTPEERDEWIAAIDELDVLNESVEDNDNDYSALMQEVENLPTLNSKARRQVVV